MSAPSTETAAPSGVQIKGAALKAITSYIDQRFGDGAHARVVAALDAPGRAAIEPVILISSWYDIELFERYLDTAASLFGVAVEALSRDAGRFSAEFGARGVYKLFMRIGSPEFIISRAANVWRSYYNRGEMTVPQRGAHTAVLELRALGYHSDILCPRLGAWMQRILELSGAKNVDVKHATCVHHGADLCRWEADWR